MEPESRNIDLRDSHMVNQSQANRRGREFADNHGAGTFNKEHVTPWGTSAMGEPSPAPVPSNPSRQFNHFQNDEAPVPQGVYRVPDMTPAHNHMQNAETDQVTDRLKMQSSKINDGNISLGEAKEGDYSGTTHVLQATGGDSVRLKVAPGTSRINDGHDIFGGPTDPTPSSRRQRPVEEPFQDRPRTGHIRNPWAGYTDASSGRR
jgi:hypothetical protein